MSHGRGELQTGSSAHRPSPRLLFPRLEGGGSGLCAGRSSLWPGNELRLWLVALTFGSFTISAQPQEGRERFASATLREPRAGEAESEETCLHRDHRQPNPVPQHHVRFSDNLGDVTLLDLLL